MAERSKQDEPSVSGTSQTVSAQTPEAPPEEEQLSRDAAHSSYKEVEPQETNPPAGKQVEQTLGKPSEDAS